MGHESGQDASATPAGPSALFPPLSLAVRLRVPRLTPARALGGGGGAGARAQGPAKHRKTCHSRSPFYWGKNNSVSTSGWSGSLNTFPRPLYT
jgi:hypothetical protein